MSAGGGGARERGRPASLEPAATSQGRSGTGRGTASGNQDRGVTGDRGGNGGSAGGMGPPGNGRRHPDRPGIGAEPGAERRRWTRKGSAARNGNHDPPPGEGRTGDHPEPEAGLRETLQRAAHAGWDLSRIEREYILATLDLLGGQKGATAEALGISRRTLYRKLESYRSRRTAGSGPGD